MLTKRTLTKTSFTCCADKKENTTSPNKPYQFQIILYSFTSTLNMQFMDRVQYKMYPLRKSLPVFANSCTLHYCFLR